MGEPREEVANVLSFLRDSLMAADLAFAIEPVEENPNAFLIAAEDKGGYQNVGIISWNEAQGVVYGAYDPVREKRDVMEGIAEDESKCWFSPDSAELMVWHLTGRLRELVKQQREIDQKALDKSG